MRDAPSSSQRLVLVTGAAGYVGSLLCRELLSAGFRVRAFDVLRYGGRSIAGLSSFTTFEFVRGDITRVQDVAAALEGVTDVVHLAAIVGDLPCQEDPKLSMEVNYFGTVRLAELSAKKRVRRFLFASTCSNYGVVSGDGIANEDAPLNPLSLYAETKVDCERFLIELGRTSELSPTIFRFGTAFGISGRTRFDLIVNSMTYEAVKQKRVVVYSPSSWRPYIHVYDMGRIISACLNAPIEQVTHRTFNAGWNAQNHQKGELVKMLQGVIPDVEVIVAEDSYDRRSYRVDFSRLHDTIELAPTRSVIDGIREVSTCVREGVLGDDDYESNRLKSRGSAIFRKTRQASGGHQGSEAIPWSVPWITNEELERVMDVFDAQWFSMGPRTEAFERILAEYVGVKHAVAVSNGTTALDVALKVLGIGSGDEVIVPALTYVATVFSVLYQGAVPVFADIELQTGNLDPDDIERCITAKTKCILYIDYGGNPADFTRIAHLAKTRGIVLLQDGAQSLGATYHGQPLCRQGFLSTTSFHAAKLMTTIEGGMIFTDDDRAAALMRMMRNQGEDPGRKYIHPVLGMNARMTDLQAAIGLKQFEKLPAILKRRAELAQLYTEQLAGAPGVLVPQVRPGCCSSWFFYPIRLVANDRDRIATELKALGIDTRVAYPMPVYEQPFFQGHRHPSHAYDCSNAKIFCRQVLNLPLFHTMTEQQVQRIVSALRQLVIAPSAEQNADAAPAGRVSPEGDDRYYQARSLLSVQAGDHSR